MNGKFWHGKKGAHHRPHRVQGQLALSVAAPAGRAFARVFAITPDHAAGSYRIFIGMAAELLMSAAQREITELDEKLYLQVFASPQTQMPCRAAPRRVAGAR